VTTLRRVAGSIWARAAVTVALLGLVALQVDWGKASHRISDGKWGWFLVAVVMIDFAFVTGALRWEEFLRAAKIVVTRLQVQRAFFVGMFSNNFLPTGFGGDAARAFVIARAGGEPLRGTVSVLADRASSLLCGLVLAWGAVIVDPGAVPNSLKALLAVATAGGIIGIGLLALILRRGRLPGWVPERGRAILRESRVLLLELGRDRRLLALGLALGLVFQVLGVGGFWACSKVIGAGAPFALMAVSVPLVLLVTVLPVSVAGFGVREGGFVVLLGKGHISATDATVISLLSAAALAIASLPGAVAMLLGASGAGAGAARDDGEGAAAAGGGGERLES
jgi:uncharacterized membrane protein YbhN (UPF0104 family)